MLDNQDRNEIDDRIKTHVQTYMQSLVETHLPKIIAAALRTHEDDIDAHTRQLEVHARTCSVSRKLNRLLYIGIGIAFGSGLGISQLLSLIR